MVENGLPNGTGVGDERRQQRSQEPGARRRRQGGDAETAGHRESVLQAEYCGGDAPGQPGRQAAVHGVDDRVVGTSRKMQRLNPASVPHRQVRDDQSPHRMPDEAQR